MNTDYKTGIIFLPTPNKMKMCELRTLTRHLLGSVYENKDFKKSTLFTNYLIYDRELSDKEKEAVKSMCTSYDVAALFIEGTKSTFDNIENIIITLEENGEARV